MAPLIQLLALLPLLTSVPDGTSAAEHGFPQRLQPGDWESISLALKANPDVFQGVARDQSFRMDAHVTVVSYFLGPPAGELKRGELGVVVIRDGKLKQIARGAQGNPITAIDALAFLDLNGDGLRDIVMIIRYLGRPGPKERQSIAFFVARKDGTFVIDPEAAPWAVEAKTIAEVKARLKEATEAKEPEEPMPPPTHSYVMDAFLDAKKQKCTGKAVMEKDRADAKSPCLVWTLTEVKCRGKGQADWVHDDPKDPNGASARICHKEGGWQYIDDLPGLGSCDVNEQKEPMPANVSPAKARFALGCIWTCRGDARSSCEGAASYEFVPLSDTPAKNQ
jgi:hypothetical protein